MRAVADSRVCSLFPSSVCRQLAGMVRRQAVRPLTQWYVEASIMATTIGNIYGALCGRKFQCLEFPTESGGAVAHLLAQTRAAQVAADTPSAATVSLIPCVYRPGCSRAIQIPTVEELKHIVAGLAVGPDDDVETIRALLDRIVCEVVRACRPTDWPTALFDIAPTFRRNLDAATA